MRARVIPSLIVALLILIATVAAAADQPAGKVYGKGLSGDEITTVSKLLAHPDEYLGKTVRVEGPVVGCCAKRGCWIEIASDQEFQTILLKVEDGEIVFPVEVIGQVAVAEGTFTGVPMNHEKACAYLEHEAQCQGQPFDKSEVPAEGITFYQIQGTGAVVRPAVN